MEEEKYQKSLRDAKWFAVGLLVLVLIVSCIKIASSGFNIMLIMQIVLLILTIKGYNEEKMYGPICGAITSILLILSKDIISLIFGILYLIDCIRIFRYMKNG